MAHAHRWRLIEPVNSEPKDLGAELQFQARQAAQVNVTATPQDVIDRYRHCRGWRIFRKEYCFKLLHECRPVAVLDFGCGTGESSTELAVLGYAVTGIDVSPDLIRLAEERARLDRVAGQATFLTVDGTNATLPGQVFDMILVQAVLHHVDLPACLETLDRLVKPDGFLLIVEPVAYSRALQWLRDVTPVEKDLSPNERQLHRGDLRLIAERFAIVQRRHFNIVGRLGRFVGDGTRWGVRMWIALQWIDYVLLHIPGMSYFAGTVVLLCQKRATATPRP